MGQEREIYVSVDIETTGAAPGLNSMLVVAAAAFNPEGEMEGVFSANLEELPGSCRDAETMQWWEGFPEAWAEGRTNLREPEEAIPAFSAWTTSLSGRPVFLSYPDWDFGFVHWYFHKFCGGDPFGFSSLDIKSYAMCMLGTPFRKTTMSRFPDRWKGDGPPRPHVALDDAIAQGQVFMKMLGENKARLAREAQ